MSDSTQKTIEFTSIIENPNGKGWNFYFVVPNEIAAQLIENGSRRVVCKLNDAVEYQCGLIPHGKEQFAVMVNKKTREELDLHIGSSVRAALRKDTSKYGLPMPEEMEEVLRQDEEGDRLFHALTAGRQRTLLYLVSSVKDAEKRIMRAIAIIEHLKATNGKVNMTQLNESLRHPLI